MVGVVGASAEAPRESNVVADMMGEQRGAAAMGEARESGGGDEGCTHSQAAMARVFAYHKPKGQSPPRIRAEKIVGNSVYPSL